MGAVRRRFTAAERELLTPGDVIEIHNGSGHWRQARVIGSIEWDSTDQQRCMVRDIDRPTRTTSAGIKYAYPKGIRECVS